MPFNSGYRGTRANDTTGIIGPQVQYLQKSFPKPFITGYSVQGSDDTALNPAGGQTVVISGGNFATGVSAILDGTQIGSVTLVSPSQLTFTAPAKASGSYSLVVYNPVDSAAAILVPGLIYSGIPTWTTAAGSIGSYYETTAINTSVVATSDSAITYAVTSGTIPTGSTFYANGVLTGTAPVDSGSTTYTFAVTATDAELQDTTRTFTVTVNTDVVTWVNPANGATITLDGTAYSNVLSATDAAGYSISSYTANTLPTGLSLSGNTISGTPTVQGNTTTLLTATAATTGRSATNTITWVVSLGDTYWDYVTTLLSASTPSPLPFNDDASTNNFAVTINGDTRPYNFNPYTPGYYSNYFDGTGDYIQGSTYSANLTPGNGDFTIELWVYPTATSGRQDWFDLSAATGTNRIQLYYNGTYLAYAAGSTSAATNLITYTVSLSTLANAWHHIAITRSSGSSKLFLDGTQVGSTYTDSLYWPDNMRPTVGKDPFGSTYITGYVSNVRFLKGVAQYTTTFTPPTSPLTAISGTGLLTCQSNRFIDNSDNNFTITKYGDTKVSSFIPFTPNSSYSTYGSTYFDGTGDYLTAPANAAFQFGTGDFTIEMWVFPTANQPQFCRYFGTGATIGDVTLDQQASGLTPTFNDNNTVFITSSIALTLNAWNHLAVTRSGTSLKMFVNGAVSGTATNSTNFTCTGNAIIGKNPGSAVYSTGYFSDVRIVKGTAVYTSAFTPPTSPLTAISGTSLLTCQSNQPVANKTFLDNSTNNFAITRNGNTTQGTFSPYGANWSNYFDGSGDYLVAGSAAQNLTGDFTIEAWVYQTIQNTFEMVLGSGLNYWAIGATNNFEIAIGSGPSYLTMTSGSAFPTNQWTHIALSRSGSSLRGFINGTQIGSTLTNSGAYFFSGALNIGQQASGTAWYYHGYISNLRVVTGTALYTSNFTPSTTPLQSIANTSLLTCQSPNLVDNSPNNFTITKNGDVSVQKFGPFSATTLPTPYYSAYFDGTGDYLSVPSNSAFAFGNGNLTVECWVYVTSTPSNMPIIGWATGSNKILRLNSSNLNFEANDPSGVSLTVAFPSSLTLNVWNHIALVRSGDSLFAYLNGVSGSATSYTGNWGNSTDALNIGYKSDPTYFNGYISNLRLVKGQALYTTTFTPSTTPLTTTSQGATASNVSLLTCQSATFIDNSTNNFTITTTGDTKPTTVNPFTVTYSTGQSYTPSVYGGSAYFDGTGDYLSLASNAAFAFGTGDFTVEYWIYHTTAPDANNRCIFNCNSGGFFIQMRSTAFGIGEVNVAENTTFNYTFTANTWYHIAVSRASGIAYGFVNGSLISSSANTTNYTQNGAWLGALYSGTQTVYGYISNFRLVKGTALYTSNFVPQNSPLQAVKNTTLLVNSTNSGIYDSSEINNFETFGDVKLSTTTVKFSGSTSMYFDGTGDYLVSRDPANPNLGSGDFTIELWLYVASTGPEQGLIVKRNLEGTGTGTWGLVMNAGGGLSFNDLQNAVTVVSFGTLSATTWTHVAVTRSGSTVRGFINGSLISSGTSSINFVNTYAMFIGIWGTTAGAIVAPFNGYMSDIRITRGIARYTSNFSVPTSPFQQK